MLPNKSFNYLYFNKIDILDVIALYEFQFLGGGHNIERLAVAFGFIVTMRSSLCMQLRVERSE